MIDAVQAGAHLIFLLIRQVNLSIKNIQYVIHDHKIERRFYMAYPSKYNGVVNVSISILDGIITDVCFDNSRQRITYNSEEPAGFCVSDMADFMAEFLENCCTSET